MGLTEFLLARVAEDEAVAGGAWRDSLSPDGEPQRWRSAGPEVTLLGGYDAVMVQTDVVDPAGALAAHAARFDPARVLAECEAKRRIVEYEPYSSSIDVHYVLEMLAQPYADHPDFNPAWRI